MVGRISGSFTHGSSGQANLLSITLNLTPGVNHTLIACIGTKDSVVDRTVNSIIQNGVTWTKQVQQKSPNHITSEIWLGAVYSSAGTSLTINFNGNASVGACNIADVCEYIPPLTLDAKTPILAANYGVSSVLNTGSTLTTSEDNELWVATGCTNATTHFSPNPSTFSQLDGQPNPNGGTISYLENTSNSIGTAQCSVTLGSSTAWVGCIAAFKPVSLLVAADGRICGTGSKQTVWGYGNVKTLVAVQSNFYDFNKTAVIENLIIDGGGYSGTTGILLENVYNCCIRNLTIRNCDVGIHLKISGGKWTEFNRIEHVRMSNVKQGILFSTTGERNLEDPYLPGDSFGFTKIDDVGISLKNVSDAIGIQIGNGVGSFNVKPYSSSIKANVWIDTAGGTGLKVMNGELQYGLMSLAVQGPLNGIGIDLRDNGEINKSIYHNQFSGFDGDDNVIKRGFMLTTAGINYSPPDDRRILPNNAVTDILTKSY